MSKGTRADAELNAGSMTQTVEVYAPDTALETTQPQLGTVIENKITQGSQCSLGVVLEIRDRTTDAVQAETQGYRSNINPPFEMVNEIQVLTTSFSAQYGLVQGVASYQFASGSDVLHGDAFEVLRDTMFDAASANPGFNADGSKQSAPQIQENNFGFSLGGPVVLSKL